MPLPTMNLMHKRSIFVVLNPTAGRGRAAQKIPVIQAMLQDAGLDFELVLSTAQSDMERRICEAVEAGATRVIVGGGDGSIHEACNGILRAGGGAGLGIIPIGTGNDFIKGAGIPLDWRKATAALIDRIQQGTPARAIDAGRMNDRYFANGAGIGFDAKINRLSQNIRLKIGGIVYLIGVVKGLIDGVITPDVKMIYSGGEYSGPVTLANVSNGPWVGGLFNIAPMANNADGELDLIFADPLTRLQVIPLVPKIMRGTHINTPVVHHRRIRHITIEASAPVPAHMDGEVVPMGTHFEIEVLPAALRLL